MAEAQDSPLALRRGRREKKKSRTSDKLAQIKRARETGVIEEDELETSEALFDYVTEEQYGQLVQERQRDGWIISNDDGAYREHGREIFDEEVQNISLTPSSKGVKKAPRRVARPSGDIKSMLLGSRPGGGGGGSRKRGADSSSNKDDTILEELLSQISEDSPQQPAKRAKQKSSGFTPRSTVSLTPVRKKTNITVKKKLTSPSQPAPLTESNHDNIYDTPTNFWDDIQEDNEVKPKEEKFENEGEEEEVMENKAEPDDTSSVKKESVPAAAVSCSGWETVREEFGCSATPQPQLELTSSSLPVHQQENGDRVLSFYWLDAYEDQFNQPGKVFLFGKVLLEDKTTYVSCCVVIKNIERCLYFLPRDKLQSKKGQPTDKQVTMEDVYAEFSSLYADPFKILRFTSKRVTKKYSFEKSEIPAESEYLEIRYSAEHQAPPQNASGHSFSHVFGTNTSSLERLILACKLKGPSWLNIINPNDCGQSVSWCKLECTADGLSSVGVASDQATPPPLTIVSLSLKTMLNPSTRINEVLCIGGLVHHSVRLDKPVAQAVFTNEFITMRRPTNRQIPYKFNEHIAKKHISVEITSNERSLLAYLLAKLHKIDADIIIGHNIASLWLDTLQHRMWACKVPHWSRIGRLKRQTMPKGKNTSHLLCCGRLICDVKLSAKELIRARSYDLPELASSLLSVAYSPMNDEDVQSSFRHHDSLTGLITHTMDEAMLALRLTHQLCVLPLAYQITCIAGNTLGRTLHGGRAERNEFLLLHAFTQKGYICPDKPAGYRKAHVMSDETEEGENPSRSSRHKPAYSGGLVLDPVVGFYDRLILLLDFNSLYPSIIQEYNICFTTVDHAHCSADSDYSNLEPPGTSVAPGILPSEIRVLVERRREVKKLMKQSCSPEQYQQYDTRQKALKLTANSMYGCLGFAHSRFLAKPLAALVTGKGREILSHTRDLAVKLGLNVIYGDTDSIMIDSGTKDLAEAKTIAQSVKTEVNKFYRLLEIEVDGIFKTMLLLKKKKYAAITLEERDGVIVEKREMKGLDIVRRDWSGIAKQTGHFVLEQILSGLPIDELIEVIQSHLSQVRENVSSNTVDQNLFVITKSLTKPPTEYPDKKSLPHVQVAMRMLSRNVPVQSGDVVPYIVCEGDPSQSNALRSFHPDEVQTQGLKVDTHYYLQHQIHAVVSRLCDPITGLDAACIANCLGLDPSAYRTHTNDSAQQEFAVAVPDTVTEPLMVKCPQVSCWDTPHQSLKGKGICVQCDKPFSEAVLVNSLSVALRTIVAKYYQGWLVCTECQNKTRSMPLTMTCPTCSRGKLQEEYSSAAVYNQLQHYKKQCSGTGQQMTAMVDKYLQQNGYTTVNLQYLFPALR